MERRADWQWWLCLLGLVLVIWVADRQGSWAGWANNRDGREPTLHPFMTIPCNTADGQRSLVSSSGFRPQQTIALADPSNFGVRFTRDARGQTIPPFEPIIVLHETVGSVEGAIDFFQTRHANEDMQVSYHTLIDLDGQIFYVVPPDRRAFGAGNSLFNGQGVQTNPRFPASVNNFAYHISLETPNDGVNDSPRHSGYTDAQYRSLAWLIAKTGIPDSRITTHEAVDQSGSRMDPRSFDWPKLQRNLSQLPRVDEIGISCWYQAAQVSQEHLLPGEWELGSVNSTGR